MLIAKWHLQVDVLRMWQQKKNKNKNNRLPGTREGGQAYTGNSCSIEELIKVPGKKKKKEKKTTGSAATIDAEDQG